MPLLKGAEPYQNLLDSPSGRAVGVLLCHGFSGSPAGMRPWAEHLVGHGYSALAPRLPGHGTRWQDLNLTRWPDWYGEVERALARLAAHSRHIVVAGMSMGGALALRLTQEYAGTGSKSLGDRLVGTMLVNPSLATERRDAPLLPLLRYVVGAFPGITNDIAKPGQDEVGYNRLPLQAAYSLQQLWKVCRQDLAAVTTPVVLYRSSVDHVVESVSSKMLLEGISSDDVRQRILPRSYHVATLDYDADFIFADSVQWIDEHVPARSETAPY